MAILKDELRVVVNRMQDWGNQRKPAGILKKKPVYRLCNNADFGDFRRAAFNLPLKKKGPVETGPCNQN